MWIFIIGDDVLTYEREEHIENCKNAVAIIWDDCLLKTAVGHILLELEYSGFQLFQFTSNHILVEITGKGVNGGVRLGLQILVNYFYGDARVNHG